MLLNALVPLPDGISNDCGMLMCGSTVGPLVGRVEEQPRGESHYPEPRLCPNKLH